MMIIITNNFKNKSREAYIKTQVENKIKKIPKNGWRAHKGFRTLQNWKEDFCKIEMKKLEKKRMSRTRRKKNNKKKGT